MFLFMSLSYAPLQQASSSSTTDPGNSAQFPPFVSTHSLHPNLPPFLPSPHLTSPHPTPSPLQTPHSSTNPHLRHDPHNNALQHAKQQMSIQILILKKIQDTFFDLPRRCRVVGACR